MPIFTYRCYQCNHKIELLCSFNDSKYKRCPNCNTAETLVRQLSNPVIRMGGTLEPTTPVDSNDDGVVMRVPEYADRNTGEKLGFGQPEILTGDNK